MYNLLNELNETAVANDSTEALIENNLNLLCECEDISYEELNEAITNWIVQKMNQIQSGSLPQEELKSTALIFGALNAVQNDDIASAFDTKSDLGTTLANVYGNNEESSQLALNRLKMIGNHPSARTFTKQAAEAIQDPNRIADFAKGLQVPIERVMNARLAKEKAASNKNPNPNGPRPDAGAGKPAPQQQDNTDINSWFT